MACAKWLVVFSASQTLNFLQKPRFQVALFILQGTADFLIGFVLAQGVYRPDGGRQPADKCELQYQADDAGNGAADGEELQPGQQQGDEQAHKASFVRRGTVKLSDGLSEVRKAV